MKGLAQKNRGREREREKRNGWLSLSTAVQIRWGESKKKKKKEKEGPSRWPALSSQRNIQQVCLDRSRSRTGGEETKRGEKVEEREGKLVRESEWNSR